MLKIQLVMFWGLKMSVQMVCATMGNSNLEATAIDWKYIYRVVPFFSFRKCKCLPGSHITRPPIHPGPPKNHCQAGEPCLYNFQLGQPTDTNCMTLTQFILAEQRKYPTADEDLSQLLTSIQSAVKAISAAVRRAGIANLGGATGDVNVQGEDMQKLDILSNELFINMLRFVLILNFLNGTY